MKKYLIASLRGNDFVSYGETPQEAWQNLVIQEIDQGTLWRTSDPYRNKGAVDHKGFSFYDDQDPSKGAYKEVVDN